MDQFDMFGRKIVIMVMLEAKELYTERYKIEAKNSDK